MAKIIVTKPSRHAVDELGVRQWPIWTCQPSTFDWHYDDRETCYFLEGQVVVTAAGEKYSLGQGDLAVFPKGLDCVWEVTQPVRKHYKLG